MNVFLAGATGVLGRRVLSLLVGNGHRVTALSRSPDNDELIRRLGGEPGRGDLFDPRQVSALSAGCDAILHLATAIPAKSRPSARDWEMNDRIRTEGTACLLAAARTNGCRAYVQQSVCYLYGDRRGDRVDETSPLATDQPRLLRSAVEMERLVAGAGSGGGLRAVILRFGMFYSFDSGQTASMFEAIRTGKFPVPGRGDAFWNLIDVDDAAAAVVRSVDEGTASGVYNVCDDEPVRCGELVEFIARTMGAPRPRRVPALIARLALGSDLARVVLASARASNRRMKEETGWRPAFPTYREGMIAEIGRWRKR